MTTLPTCANCAGQHHTQRCPEIRALLFNEAAMDRIITNVLDRLDNPRPCQSCGDLTVADLCAACSEWGVDPYGISLELRQQVRATAAERVEFAPF